MQIEKPAVQATTADETALLHARIVKSRTLVVVLVGFATLLFAMTVVRLVG